MISKSLCELIIVKIEMTDVIYAGIFVFCSLVVVT